jgi:hypothetical protein
MCSVARVSSQSCKGRLGQALSWSVAICMCVDSPFIAHDYSPGADAQAALLIVLSGSAFQRVIRAGFALHRAPLSCLSPWRFESDLPRRDSKCLAHNNRVVGVHPPKSVERIAHGEKVKISWYNSELLDNFFEGCLKASAEFWRI